MMFAKRKSSLMILAALSVSNAWAGYDGPKIDYNFVDQEPGEYRICFTPEYQKDVPTLNMCNLAKGEARILAERFGGGNGRIEGYLRGFSWGLYSQVKAYQNNGDEMARGAAAVTAANYRDRMESGLNAGRNDGARDGNSQGRAEAEKRWSAAVDTGQAPSAEFTIPATNYQGVDDAYQRYVRSPHTIQQILKEDINDELKQIKVYGTWDSDTLGDIQQHSIWDFWFDNGEYRFQIDGWKYSPAALDIWYKRPNFSKTDYNTIQQTAPLKDPKNPALGRVDMKPVFDKVFKEVYEYYVNFYFSREFKRNIDDGQVAGRIGGMEAGRLIAFETGLMQAFNSTFKESAKGEYRGAYETAYTTGFKAIYLDYAEHPKLDLQLKAITGDVDDGIIQPGEAIAAQFIIRNKGGKPAEMTASLEGDVVDAKLQKFNIAALRSSTFDTLFIARINPRLQARQKARITLHVRAPDNDKFDSIDQTVLRLIELKNLQTQMEPLAGTGRVRVAMENISTRQPPRELKLQLLVDGQVFEDRTINTVDPQSIRSETFELSGIDPVALLNGNIPVQVSVRMNEVAMDAKTSTLGVADRYTEITRYFDLLVNGKGYVPSDIEPADRLAEIKNWIVSRNVRQVKARTSLNIWKDAPQSTVIGRMLSLMRANGQTDASRDAYDALGKEFMKSKSLFGKGMFFRSEMGVSYENLVKDLLKNAE